MAPRTLQLVNELKRFCQELDREKPVQEDIRIKTYKLVKVIDGRRKNVAFGLTFLQAETLKTQIQRRMIAPEGPYEGLYAFEIEEVAP